MKKIKSILIFINLALNFLAFGQMRYGSVEYEIKVNLDKRFPISGNTNFKGGNRNQFNTSNNGNYLIEKATLYFTDTLSLFITKPLEDVNDQRKTFTTVTLTDLINKTLTTNINLLGENFTIVDTLPKRIWKYTNKVRDIAGIECQQVFAQIDDSTKIYAWFDPQVIPAVGPESYGDLPGVILGLAYEDGSITYFATKMNTDYPTELQNYTLISNKKKYTRHAFNKEFSTKYDTSNRYHKLIEDLLHFY